MNQPTAISVEEQIAVSHPGLHIIGNFRVNDAKLLIECSDFEKFILERVNHYQLSIVGQVFHNFPTGGYTGVLCLTESHLSIHTWPERKYVTFDIFLSNFMNDNRSVTRAVYEEVKVFFAAKVVMEQIIER